MNLLTKYPTVWNVIIILMFAGMAVVNFLRWNADHSRDKALIYWVIFGIMTVVKLRQVLRQQRQKTEIK